MGSNQEFDVLYSKLAHWSVPYFAPLILTTIMRKQELAGNHAAQVLDYVTGSQMRSPMGRRQD